MFTRIKFSLVLLIILASCHKGEQEIDGSLRPIPKAVKGVMDLRVPRSDCRNSTDCVETKSISSNHSKTGFIPSKITNSYKDGWDFEKDGSIDLDGEWEFYWKEFVPPNSLPMSNEELRIKNAKTAIPHSSFLIPHS